MRMFYFLFKLPELLKLSWHMPGYMCHYYTHAKTQQQHQQQKNYSFTKNTVLLEEYCTAFVHTPNHRVKNFFGKGIIIIIRTTLTTKELYIDNTADFI